MGDGKRLLPAKNRNSVKNVVINKKQLKYMLGVLEIMRISTS